MNISKTARGFDIVEFEDSSGAGCSLQKSSIATEDCVWLGVSDANPKVMHKDAKKLGVATEANCGWVDYPVPPEVLLHTRMHLTQDQVAELLPILTRFVETGEVSV